MFSIEKQKQFMNFSKHSTSGTNIDDFLLYKNLINEKTSELVQAIKEKNYLETIDAILDIASVVCGTLITVEHYRFELELLEKTGFFERLIESSKYNHEFKTKFELINCQNNLFNSATLIKKLHYVIFLAAELDIDLNLAMSKFNDNLLSNVIDNHGNIIVKYSEDNKIIKSTNFIPFNPQFILENPKTKNSLDELFLEYEKIYAK